MLIFLLLLLAVLLSVLLDLDLERLDLVFVVAATISTIPHFYFFLFKFLQ